jgi:hypothetical protein
MLFKPEHFCLYLYLLFFIAYIGQFAYRKLLVYRKQHTGLTPRQAFSLCHILLEQVVRGAYELLPHVEATPPTQWERFTVSTDGISFLPLNAAVGALVPVTEWQNVSGVGLEMRPLYDYHAGQSFWHIATRVNTGYQFNIVVVPRVGETITVTIPLRNNDLALQFAAHLLAFARSRSCRLSLMGFDKELTKGVVHLPMF